MVGERVAVKVVSVPGLKYSWHGTVRKYKLWFWPVVTYHCWHSAQDECLKDVFNVVNSLYAEEPSIVPK